MQLEEAKNPTRTAAVAVGRDVVPSPYSNRLSNALEQIHDHSINNSDSAALRTRTYSGSASSEDRSIEPAMFKSRPHTDRADPELVYIAY